MTADEMHEVFAEWNTGELDSYLIEITRDILGYQGPETGTPLVDKILDTAGQKGTGKWTVITALRPGHPADADQRGGLRALPVGAEGRARRRLQDPARARRPSSPATSKAFIDDVEKALYASKIISYAQGYELMHAAAQEYELGPQLRRHRADVAGRLHHPRAFLGKIKEAFDRNPKLTNLLLDSVLPRRRSSGARTGWRRVVGDGGARTGSRSRRSATALAYFDGYRSGRLPANLLQAQRDYFGAHTYERIDQPRGQFFHTNWTGRGGDTASSAYIV